MRLADARKLRDRIRARGIDCTVPLGYGPDGYWCQIHTTDHGTVTFFEERDFDSYMEHRQTMRSRSTRHLSPIDRMIDAACGQQ